MDEWTLNDLLECSVCLERLDTSSKVLPCQHTFCKKCLEEIVSTKKELRCPECRVLVDTSIDDLPPNVLLMRILEGMRNAAPKRRGGGAPPVHHQRSHSQPIAGTVFATPVAPTPNPRHAPPGADNSQPHHNAKPVVMQSQPYARAIYDYNSKEPGDLSFKKGDIITLKKQVDHNWYHGELGNAQGVFPLCYVQIIPVPTHIPQCKALYDFRMTNDEEEGCLTFSKGEILTVIRRVDENWAEGRLADRVGIFPLAFVEMNGVARALMKLSTNSQRGPSRLAPPTPTSEETTPLIPTDHSRLAVPVPVPTSQPLSPPQQQSSLISKPQQNVAVVPSLQQPHLQSDSSSSVTSSVSTTPNSSGTSSSSSTSTTPSSPASPPPRPSAWSPQTRPTRPAAATAAVAAAAQNQDGSSPQTNQHKRHSLTALLAAQPPTHQASNRHSAEVLGSADITEAGQNTSGTGEFTRQGSGRIHRRSGSSELPLTSAGSIPPPLPQGIHHSLAISGSLPATYIALYPYKPQKADELELRKGGVYTVTERCQDGWFKGTSNRTQKSGVFPGNYVAQVKSLPGTNVLLRNMSRGSSNSGTPTRSASSGAVSPHVVAAVSALVSATPTTPVSYTRERKSNSTSPQGFTPRQQQPGAASVSDPPSLPPRSLSPASGTTTWHATGLITADSGRSSASTSPQAQVSQAAQSGAQSSQQSSPQATQGGQSPNSSASVSTTPAGTPSKSPLDKSREKKERGGVSLMRRLTNMKKSKSPPPPYSMDNPVFEDGTIINNPPLTVHPAHAVHVRSGSCPSQLLQLPPPEVSASSVTPAAAAAAAAAASSTSVPTQQAQAQPHHRLFTGPVGGSQRLRHKERPNVVLANLALSGRQGDLVIATATAATAVGAGHHRKSNSLDAGSSHNTNTNGTSSGSAEFSRKAKQLVQPARERFRCVVAYPPHSEYELELRVGDVIYVHRKREDGWYKGTQQRTGRTGLFPASFVEAF